MKKFLSIALCAVMVLGILAGCGQKGNDTPKNNDNSTALSGSVSTNGSTSMDKVIGALKEQFTADNPNVTVTYDPTGSGAGIEAVKNGSADIGLASRERTRRSPPVSRRPPWPWTASPSSSTPTARSRT